MNKLVAQIRVATEQSIIKKKKQNPDQPQYEYDSDEDTEGGTWEHKKRAQEMLATYGEWIALLQHSHYHYNTQYNKFLISLKRSKYLYSYL